MKIDKPIPACLAKHGITSVEDNLQPGQRVNPGLLPAGGQSLFMIHFRKDLVKRLVKRGNLSREVGDE